MTKLLRLFLLLCPLALAGCAVNPATGENQLSLVSPAQEAQIGAEEHPKVLAEFGGPYNDPKVQEFVQRIGQRLAAASGRADITYTFTVLDSEVVNAFALPGGYVYITRGLLALANSEAEVAGVLGHEMGHVTARHTAQRISQSTIANVLVAGLGIALGSPEATQALGLGSELLLKSYSRDQELESDGLGVAYLTRAGYDPYAVARFLETMNRDAQLRAALQGEPEQAGAFSYFSTHPPTEERVQRAAAAARQAGARDGADDRDSYLAAVDGMVWGDSTEHGFVRGREFAHPQLGFRFEVPQGFSLLNGERQVVARGPGGAAIVFDAGRPRFGGASMAQYLAREWAPNAPLQNVEALDVNGLAAATGTVRVDTRGGPADVRLVAIRAEPGLVYRFLFITPPQLTAELSPGLRQTTYSFRRLTTREAARYQPLRLQAVTVQPDDTVESLAARMPPGPYAEERFRVLNDLPPGTPLPAGRKVKLITEG